MDGLAPDSITTRGPAGPDPLEEATYLEAATQLELEAKGYAPSLSRAAVSRARGAAEAKTRPISPSIRPQAFRDMLAWELRKAEDWCARVQIALDAPDADMAEKGGESE